MGTSSEKTQPLVDMDPRALRQLQRLGLLRAGRARLEHKRPLLRHPSGGREVLVEPHALADRVGHLAVLDEHAGPAPCMNRAGVSQIRKRAPHRVPVDAEARGELRLGRQAFARRVMAPRDFIAKLVADRGPEGGSSQAVTKVS